jgi:hypothetical protein
MPASRFEAFIGGSMWSVAVKLILLSLIVGFLLAYFEWTPWDVLVALQSEISRLWRQGWRMLLDIGSWILIGAVFVVPLWLLTRVFARKR